MAIENETKREVIADWRKAFPQLSFFAQNKLYKAVGPIIIGLELIKSPFTSAYSPYFVIYPLWRKGIKATFDYPILLKEFKNGKGIQYDIPYEMHRIVFEDVLSSISRQILLSFEGDISFKKLEAVLDEYSKTPPLSAAPNSYLQALLQEAKLKIALSISSEEAQSILEKIRMKNWDLNHFKACGIDFNEWMQSLKNTIINRDEFLKQIEVNRGDKKILQLNSSQLTM